MTVDFLQLFGNDDTAFFVSNGMLKFIDFTPNITRQYHKQRHIKNVYGVIVKGE
ncbi:hypothetical protein ORD22_10430 [Sporosarcina sp. GW1-11]|uniref:hypothetical protein n=1 Tax=Sporosarcina sp. GW1-11 TaxID=2899126 RepID=UPI00294F9DB4|nr:hypothetical protein [Sporosarcina sp. GW1-11]MDV6378630.1 hypothetical protein [Sporosarcina sp. GW1-11]